MVILLITAFLGYIGWLFYRAHARFKQPSAGPTWLPNNETKKEDGDNTAYSYLTPAEEEEIRSRLQRLIDLAEQADNNPEELRAMLDREIWSSPEQFKKAREKEKNQILGELPPDLRQKMRHLVNND